MKQRNKKLINVAEMGTWCEQLLVLCPKLKRINSHCHVCDFLLLMFCFFRLYRNIASRKMEMENGKWKLKMENGNWKWKMEIENFENWFLLLLLKPIAFCKIHVLNFKFWKCVYGLLSGTQCVLYCLRRPLLIFQAGHRSVCIK